MQEEGEQQQQLLLNTTTATENVEYKEAITTTTQISRLLAFHTRINLLFGWC